MLLVIFSPFYKMFLHLQQTSRHNHTITQWRDYVMTKWHNYTIIHVQILMSRLLRILLSKIPYPSYTMKKISKISQSVFFGLFVCISFSVSYFIAYCIFFVNIILIDTFFISFFGKIIFLYKYIYTTNKLLFHNNLLSRHYFHTCKKLTNYVIFKFGS